MIPTEIRAKVASLAKSLWPDDSAAQLRYYEEQIDAFSEIQTRRNTSAYVTKSMKEDNEYLLSRGSAEIDEPIALFDYLSRFNQDHLLAVTESPDDFVGQLNILHTIDSTRSIFFEFDDVYLPKELLEQFRSEILTAATDKSGSGYTEMLRQLTQTVAAWRMSNLAAIPQSR